MIRFLITALFCLWVTSSPAEMVDITGETGLKSATYIHVPGGTLTEVQLFVPVGEVDATGPEGIAHYLEHLVAYSAEGRRGAQGRDHQTNAHTSISWTIYQHRGRPDSIVRMLQDLRNVFNPVDLDPPFMWSELKVVQREFDRQRDNTATDLARAARRHLYGGHGLARSVIGTPESIQQMTPAAALALHRQHYNPATSHLLISGPIPQDLVRRAVRVLFRDLRGGPAAPRGYAAPWPAAPAAGLPPLQIPGVKSPETIILHRVAAPTGLGGLQLLAATELLQELLQSGLDGGLKKLLYYDEFIIGAITVRLAILPTGDVEMLLGFVPEVGVTPDAALTKVRAALQKTAASGLPGASVTRIIERAVARSRGRKHELATYPAQVARTGIMRLGRAIDVETYQQALASSTAEQLSALLSALTATPHVITARADNSGVR